MSNILQFRNMCLDNVEFIKKIKIKNFSLNSDKETVFIDFRILPHVEFLIRNVINKLNSSWSHTVICGIENYDFMKNMCEQISPNIKVINSNLSNMSQQKYSDLLCTLDFWNLLYGDKILLYQEDSCMFKNNIEEFLIYDYIGAAWGHLNPLESGGNGGFSLRSKKVMIDCINTETPYFPEDLYFCRTITKHKLGNLSPWEKSNEFSTEYCYNLNSLGGHKFWECDPSWKNRMYALIFEIICEINKKV